MNMEKDKVMVKLNLILNSLLAILLTVSQKVKDSSFKHNIFILANFHKGSLMEKDNKQTNKCSLRDILHMVKNSKENLHIQIIFIKESSKIIYSMVKEKLITFITTLHIRVI